MKLLIFILLIPTVACIGQKHKDSCLKKSGLSLDSFNYQYKETIRGRIKQDKKYIYGGTLCGETFVNGIAYQLFVFGDTINKPICLLRVDDTGLYFLPYSDSATLAKAVEEKVFLYFNKPKGEIWGVNIGDEYLWRREFQFLGVEKIKGDEIFIYDILPEKHVLSVDHLTKLYFSKTNGIVKFVIQTHWFPVTVERIKR